ncbi:TauD/TfdA family dioxygenase [Pseudoalteromonas sp. MQS005]|uniref:TauD/TfdA family dioxygenase n=1 Tax=Pseudoalteromonas sp. MQS005 TaxID=1854052 RepID=UPI0007E4F456|nr:TauD/TfdA family dioxygenase [Pseudoalteromonas sp. MQS005]
MLDLGDLEHNGVVIIDNISSRAELKRLAKSIGEIRPHPNGENIATLKSSDGRSSLPGTLSNIYGLSAFPFHTDTAFWGIPARYVVMGMFSKSQCTTNYISLSDITRVVSNDFRAKAEKSIYLVETFEGCKYTSPIFCQNGVSGIRFDPNIMKPANVHAERFHSELLEALRSIEPRKIHWDGNKAVVFDNWKNLHGRSAVNNERREIFRIYLES